MFTKLELQLQKLINTNNPIVFTNSGTSALLCGLYSCGLEKDDLVLGPNYGYFAWYNVTRFMGLTPVIAGINKETLCMSYEDVKELVKNNNKIRVIFYIYHAGIIDDDILRIRDLCDKNSIYLIEDSCYSLGVSCTDVPLFSVGDISTISFSEKKLIDSGEGGAIIINNHKLYDKCMECQFHGNWHRGSKNQLLVGLNLQMNGITARFISNELESINDKIYERNKVFKILLNNGLPVIHHKNQNAPGRFILHVNNAKRTEANIKRLFPKIDIEVYDNYKTIINDGTDEYLINIMYLPVYNSILRYLAVLKRFIMNTTI